MDILRMRFGTAGKVIAVDGKSIRGTAKSGEPPQPAADSQRICDRKRRGAGARGHLRENQRDGSMFVFVVE